MTKPNSPYDFDTHDVAEELVRDIKCRKEILSKKRMIEAIEKKLDEMVRDGKIRVYERRHHDGSPEHIVYYQNRSCP